MSTYQSSWRRWYYETVMNDLERWNKAALQVMHEAKDLGFAKMDLECIQDRLDKWKADQDIAAVIATEFYTWVTKEKEHFHPDSTLKDIFKTFWHDHLGKP